MTRAQCVFVRAAVRASTSIQHVWQQHRVTGRDRTCGLRFWRPLLCLLSYLHLKQPLPLCMADPFGLLFLRTGSGTRTHICIGLCSPVLSQLSYPGMRNRLVVALRTVTVKCQRGVFPLDRRMGRSRTYIGRVRHPPLFQLSYLPWVVRPSVAKRTVAKGSKLRQLVSAGLTEAHQV